MQRRFIAMFVVILIAVLIVIGYRTTEQTIRIGNCQASFSTEPIGVTSPLCGNGTSCVAQPAQLQNNAVVDVLLCACAQAKAESYANAELSRGIENLTASFFGYSLTAASLCDQQAILAKQSYG